MASELEQFCLIAKSQKDRACANIIQQVLKDKKIHVFGELLAIPSVQALRGTEFENALTTLELFAYGSVSEYQVEPTKYLEMTNFMMQKLRRVTLFSLAAQTNKLSYETLLHALQLQTVRELEDFIIDTIYSGFVRGKLDQMGQVFNISWVTPRDIRPEMLSEVIDRFSRWRHRASEAKEMLQKTSNELALNRAQTNAENLLVQQRAEDQRQLVREKMENGMIEMDEGHRVHHTVGSGSATRGKPARSTSSAADRLGLGIGGGIGGGRSTTTTSMFLGGGGSRSKY